MKELIVSEFGEAAYDYLAMHSMPGKAGTEVLHSTNAFNVLSLQKPAQNIVNLSKVNNLRFINKYFEGVNSKLDTGGVFIGCYETINAR